MTTQHLPSKWAPVRRMGLLAVDLAMAWAAGFIVAATVLWGLGREEWEMINEAYLWAGGCCGSAFLGGVAQTLISLAPLTPFAAGAALWWWLGRPRVHAFANRPRPFPKRQKGAVSMRKVRQAVKKVSANRKR